MKALYYYNPPRRREAVGGFYLVETCSDGHGDSGRLARAFHGVNHLPGI